MMAHPLPAIRAVRRFYGLASTHVSNLPRLAGTSLTLRLIRLIFQPPYSTEYRFCSSKWCSIALPLLYSFDSLMKGLLGVCIFLVIVSSIGETNARFVMLTIPALCYAIFLTITASVKASFNSWAYIRSNEISILAGNGFLCISLILHALNFDQRPTKEDNIIRFTRKFTIWLCTIQIAITIEWLVCFTVQWFHKWRKHLPNDKLRNRRLAELHRTFKDLRIARYGGLTLVSEPESGHEVDDNCVYFPRSKLPVGQSPSYSLVETDETKLLPQFLRCSCCVENSSSSYPVPSEHDNEQNNGYTPRHLESRLNLRTEFLTSPGWQHLVPDSDEVTPAVFKPHSLCNICRWICCASSLLQSRDSFNPSRHFGLFIRDRECFDHYSTPQELFDSVGNGCHLCTLIWTSMSPAQRETLLTADATLQNQREQLLATTLEDKERNAIEGRYRRHRRIRLVIESFDGDIPPTDSQVRRAHSLELGKGAAQIVPHFGIFKRPRRWMPGIRDFENHMLVEQGESEFAPPILVLQCRPQISGPIKMPLSNSTGSEYAMSLIQRWLRETEATESNDFFPGRVLHVGSVLEFGIVRILDRDEIVSRVLTARNNDGDSLMAGECDHKFAMGCINTSGQQCCACLAEELKSSQRLLNIQTKGPPYCPRCEEYQIPRGAKKYKVPSIDISKDFKNLEYVALSHCWGKDTNFLKLTLENQHSLRLGVSTAELTKTFRQAIHTAASLGYSFLWIDSLCIIQDSMEDWKRESATMRDIYKNSSFTIVASAAWSGKEGLFRVQDPLSNHPCVLGVRVHEGDTKVTYAIPSQMDIEKTRRIELEVCNWNRRGWCLQERALPRRIVYFGESQLHFELKNDSGEVVHLQSQGNERSYFEPNRFRPESSVARGYSSHMWWEYVNSYTQRHLTYRSDKPLAIRGLVASMEDAGIPMFLPTLSSKINLPGTVSNDFIASLLWFVDKDTTSRPSSEADTYPTWSWLSVDGVVFNDSAGEVYENSTLSVQEFIETEVVRGGDDDVMFAAGTKGLQLRVKGKLKGARWKVVHDQFYFARRGGVDALCSCPPGYRDQELLDARELQKHNRRNPGWWPRSEGRFEYLEMIKPISNDAEMGPRAHLLQTDDGLPVGWLVPDTTDALPQEIYCLEIRVEPITPIEKYKLINTWVVRGLALNRVEDCPNTQLPVYSRVGYFELDQKHNGFLHSDLAFDWKFPPAEREGLRNNFLRVWPDVDPHGFFKGISEQEFIVK